MRRLRRPRPDSAGGEGEEDAAERAVVFDLLGAAPVDGVELDRDGGALELGWRKGARREGAGGENW